MRRSVREEGCQGRSLHARRGVCLAPGQSLHVHTLPSISLLCIQYLGSLNLLRVDWPRVASRFESLFYTTDAAGRKKAPNVASLFRLITDFLTADFQQRASFIAGFLLGIRIG